METRKNIAVEKKKTCNCAQTVLATYADMAGLTEKQAMDLGNAFGSGMGNMEGTCGALVAAVMTAGLRLGGKGTLRLSRRISENFSGRCGAVRCRDLKGLTTGKELCSCADCVKNAVLAYGEVMGLE
jgi:C_GCAxxG_C_C family probable redox protein